MNKFEVIKGDNKGYKFYGKYYKDSKGGEWYIDQNMSMKPCTKKFYSFDEVKMISK